MFEILPREKSIANKRTKVISMLGVRKVRTHQQAAAIATSSDKSHVLDQQHAA